MAPLVSTKISSGFKVIQEWRIAGDYENGATVKELFCMLMHSVDDDKLVCHVGESKTGSFQNVSLEAKVSELVEFGRYIKFDVDLTGVGVSLLSDQSLEKNAFSVLMSVEKSLPEKRPESNAKNKLFNDVIDLLDKQTWKFPPELKTKSEIFVSSVVNSLWALDPHLDKLAERSCYLPLLLERFTGYNQPQAYKQKAKPLNRDTLLTLAHDLDLQLDQPFVKAPIWRPMYNALKELSDSIHKYADYLKEKSVEMSQNRQSLSEIRPLSDKCRFQKISKMILIKPALKARYKDLNRKLSQVSNYEYICLDEYTPSDTRQRRYYIDCLSQGVQYDIMHYTVASGNSYGSLHFIWKIDTTNEESTARTNDLVQDINNHVPRFHTRAMRKNFLKKCSLVMNSKPSVLRNIYARLTGDASVCEDTVSAAMDDRIKQILDMEDPDILLDMRAHNPGRPPVYDVFFDKCKEYIENVVEEAVDERRHDNITHLATAISVRDLKEQVAKLCPEGTSIPSEQWLRLQFVPKVPSNRASMQYTGKLQVKFCVQSRQFRKNHIDSHYASAVFRYEKEMAVKFREYAKFIAMDDKHACKVGEPNYPVAAVERGRRVLVGLNKSFVVADHDFTKLTVVPSVIFDITIPEDVTGSFYDGQVHVGIKNQAFESSSPIRHMSELKSAVLSEDENEILFLYTDGGPDHRLTYLSVQISLLALFITADLDLLVAARTPPYWKDPAERVMSNLNLGLQAVGLMRSEMSPEFENIMKPCSSTAQIREKAKTSQAFREAVSDSLDTVKILLSDIFRRLRLKDKPFQIFNSSSKEEMDQLLSSLDKYGDVLNSEEMSAKSLRSALATRPQLKELMDHCMTAHHYSLTIKKCGEEDCNLCSPVRLPRDVFEQLHVLPDPVPGDDGHYKPFDDVYGKATDESHRPSLQEQKRQSHGMPFSPTAQTANTVKEVFNCIDCCKPRVIYAQRSITFREREILEKLKSFYDYSCGSILQDLITDNDATPQVNALLRKLFVRANLQCADSVECAYFRCECFFDVCYFCGEDEALARDTEEYPLCQKCNATTTERPVKRKRAVSDSAKGGKKRRK